MRGRRVGAVVALAMVAGAAALVAADQAALQSRVDDVFSDIDRDGPGCSLSVARRGELWLSGGYGMANLEYGVRITPGSVFHVASVSKQFTAMSVALLVVEGKVAWTDDIRTYVPEVPDFGQTITLRHLVTHTSGLRDQWTLLGMAGWRFEADVITQDDVLEITSRQRALNFAPGDEYLYSNTGFTLLAVVVERVSGQSLRDFTTTRIFEPLGMSATHFHDDHNMIVPNRAYGYAPDGDGYRLSIPDFDVVGATSLFTTAEDMVKWDRNFISARVGGRAVLDDLLTNGVLNSGERLTYAAGIAHGEYRGLPTVEHSGADAGYRSAFVRFPGEGLTVTVLCSFGAADPGARARRVADVVLEDRFRRGVDEDGDGAAGVTLTDAQRARVTGVYARDDTDVLERVRVDDEGRLRFGNAPMAALTPERFRVGADELVLAQTADGTVTLTGRRDYQTRTLRQVAPAADGAGASPDYVGAYWSDDLGVEYRIDLVDGALHVWHRKIGSRRLTARAIDRFAMPGMQITFNRDGRGRVDGFTGSAGRVRKVRFDRR